MGGREWYCSEGCGNRKFETEMAVKGDNMNGCCLGCRALGRC